MSELRNEIRREAGRFERSASLPFTKEELAAIYDTAGYDIDTQSLPSKAQMRAGILWTIGDVPTDDPDAATEPFRKDDLTTILTSLQED